MKQVITAYGKFLLEGMVFTLLMAGVFCGDWDESGKKGILAAIGERLAIEGPLHSGYTDFRDVYRTESEKKAPQITYIGGRLQTGINRLYDAVKAVDYEGKELQVRITSVKSPEGTELLDVYNQETSEVKLEQPGIYTIEVCAADDIYKVSRCMIRIPVNGGGEQD